MILLSLGGALKTVQLEQQPIQPFEKEYFRLGQYLLEYIEIVNKGGWNELPTVNLKPGDRDDAVLLLRHRLMLEKYLSSGTPNTSSYFDRELETALTQFQFTHGLKTNGHLDKVTLNALNVSARERVDQLSLNMDRWAYLPDFNTLPRYCIVNVADYKMTLAGIGPQLIEKKVIVGRLDRKTPVLNAQLNQIILNPNWYVPPLILKEDIIPQLRKDPTYLERHEMYLLSTKNGESVEVPYDSVKWGEITATHFPYAVIQKPGPSNALGAVKFVFPNVLSVYMHDTPTKNLFAASQRTFSSGCIRVDQAVAVAKAVLAADDAQWTSKKVDQMLATGHTHSITLKHPFPVYITYITAWVDQKGQLQFREDIYQKDQLNTLNY